MRENNKILTNFLSISAISYVIGFIIVNLHFSQWGFFSFDLLKAQYVTAGIWFIIIFIIIVIAYIFYEIISVKLYILYDKFDNDNPWIFEVSSIIIFLLSICITGIIFAGSLYFIAEKLWIDTNWKQLVPLLIFLILIQILEKFEPSSGENNLNSFSDKMHKLREQGSHVSFYQLLIKFPQNFLLISILTIVAIYGFSISIYGSIPQTIGGGKPSKVDVLFSEKKLSHAARLGLVSLDSNEKIKLALLTRSSTGIVFIIDNPQQTRSIEVKENFVEAIIFQELRRK